MNGKLYWSKWPRSQKSARTADEAAARETFKSMSRATLYMSAAEQIFARKLAAGTKLLPRDLLMMALYCRMGVIVTTEGRKIYSMPAIQDVSDTLDAIMQIPGGLLLRGPNFWEGLAAGTPGQQLIIDSEGNPSWGAVAAMQMTSVYRNAALNSPANTWGRLNFDTVQSDVPGWWVPASFGVRPNVAGNYLVLNRARTNTGGSIVAGYGLNGALAGATGTESNQLASAGARVVALNGTTDIVSTFMFTSSARAYTVGLFDCWMQVIGPL